jgi:hypothetical protein
MSDERKTERMGRLDRRPTGSPLPPAVAPGRPSRKVTETQPIGAPIDPTGPNEAPPPT